MIYMTRSFSEWCLKYHRELYVPLMFGHIECLDEKIYIEYLEWMLSKGENLEDDG